MKMLVNLYNRHFVVMLFICSALFFSCETKSEIIPQLFVGNNKLQQPFGLCSHISRTGECCEFDVIDKELATINNVGATMVRTDFDWGIFRTEKRESLSFKRFDVMVEKANDNNIGILGILPPATRDEHELWTSHVSQLINRYKNNIKYWEVLNEADFLFKRIAGFCAADYLDLLSKGCTSIRLKGEGTKVLFSGINPLTSFADSVFQMGGGKFFDIMNMHQYTYDKDPESLLDVFRKLSDLLEKYKIRKTVWMTETGYPTKGKLSVSEVVQAQNLPRIYLIALSSGVDKVFWYKSRSRETDSIDREAHFGIWHKDCTPKPAFYSYKTMTQMLNTGSTRPRLIRKGNTYFCFWKRHDGKRVYALWNNKGNKLVKMEIKGKAEFYNYMGENMQVSNEIVIGKGITYIVGPQKIDLVN